MVIVIVEHFLNQEGKLYFYSWLKEVREELKYWSGFKRIELLKKSNEVGSFLYMEFNSNQELSLWGNSHKHEQLLTKLRPFQLKKQYSELYEFHA